VPNYGKSTSSIMDVPLQRKSVFTPYVGDNGYRFEGLNTVYVLSNSNGTLVTYDESSATAPFGSVALATPNEQELTLAYNQAMIKRIQNTQMQDVPVSAYAKKWAVQQVYEVFIPAHDAYSLGKLRAARPAGNVVTTTPANWAAGTDKLSLQFEQAINKARLNGKSDTNQMVAWLAYDFAANLSSQINFTGSDQGYKDAQSGYLGRHKGVVCVETPDDFFDDGVYVIVADKRAIVAVKPKMSPDDGQGYVVLEKVPQFSGIEIQLRDRGDTFVLNQKASAIATIEDVASTTTTTTTTA
jgi:hypothetical protein